MLHAGAVVAITDGQHEHVLDAIRTETPDLREVICVGAKLPGSHDFWPLVDAAQPQPAQPSGAEDVCLLLYSAGSGPGELPRASRTARAPSAPRTTRSRKELLQPHERGSHPVRRAPVDGVRPRLRPVPRARGAGRVVAASRSSRTPARCSMRCATYKPTVLFATPSVYAQLAHDAEKESIPKPLAKLRVAVAGAEGMPERLIPRIRSVLGTEVVVGYGLTEIFQFALAGRTDDPGARPGVCGKPLAGVVGPPRRRGRRSGRRRRDRHARAACGSLFTGYWGGNGGDHHELRADGWFTTRDRFMVDRDGFYHHCGRVDDLFKVGGKWVSPSEVERALTAHEGVWECAVIGADDDEGLIKPLAFVVTNVGWEGGPKLEARAQGVRQEVARAVQVPALDRVRRVAAARPGRQAAALQAAPRAPSSPRRDRHRPRLLTAPMAASDLLVALGLVEPGADTLRRVLARWRWREPRCRSACARSIPRGSRPGSQACRSARARRSPAGGERRTRSTSGSRARRPRTCRR